MTPPYQDTVKYTNNFNHQDYWNWVREISKNNIVFCSEYSAPDDFVCIWQQEIITTLDKSSRKKAIEKLFVWNKGMSIDAISRW